MRLFDKISKLIAEHRGGAHSLVKKLDREGLRHLSWSKIATVESCRYRYYLEYVERVKLAPEPDYFVKGRILHAAAERFYRGMRDGSAPGLTALTAMIERHKGVVARQDIQNAIELLIANAFYG